MRKKNNFGRFYQEFKKGEKISHWPGKTITEAENSIFCMITMNHHPIHIDKIFAKKTKFKKRVVVGTFVFSLVVGMTVKEISGKAIANLNYEEINHINPVFIGDTIYVKSQIIDKKISKSSNKKGKVRIFTKAFNQNNKEVISFYRNILVPLK